MTVAIDFSDAVLSVTAHGVGLGDMSAMTKRIERLARGAGIPFGVLLDLSDGGPAAEGELAELLASVLYTLPDHGLRELAMVLQGPPEAFEGLRTALVTDDPVAARAITLWSTRAEAEIHLRTALGLEPPDA
jgi:hypothetical protein